MSTETNLQLSTSNSSMNMYYTVERFGAQTPQFKITQFEDVTFVGLMNWAVTTFQNHSFDFDHLPFQLSSKMLY